MLLGHQHASIPEMVMRTGVIETFNPLNARQDINVNHVERITHIPVGTQPGTINGADANGQPVREFPPMQAAPDPESAKRAVAGLQAAARLLRDRGLTTLGPDLVGGPLSAMARGETVVLRWTNGVAISASLF